MEILETSSYVGDFLCSIHAGHSTHFTSVSLNSLLTKLPYDLCHIDKYKSVVLCKTDNKLEKVVSDQIYHMTFDLIVKLESLRLSTY